MAKVVYKLGNDVSTDVIYPGRYMATVLPTETPQYAFADDATFNEVLKKGITPGSVIVAADNFGCGSSREQAASTLKGHGLIVVAKGFARIFLQNAVNLGLQTIISPDLEAEVDHELAITEKGITNLTTGKKYTIIALPQARQAIINAGGLIPYARKKLLEKLAKA